ncbi:MAG: pyruvate kinase [Coxiellaceae bacterium]|nr:pyruvate kinase [Coxiellaceae bacterium]
MRRTKIIATLGPSTDDPVVMEQLILAGLNVVRLNFSHGSHEEHQKRIELVRTAAKKCNRIVGILADMQGPKIRVANFKDGKVELKKGASFVLDASLDSNAGTVDTVGIDYKELPQDVSPGDELLLDDGRISLLVDKVNGAKIHCTVDVGGKLSNHKGINRRGGGLSAKALTDKDREDIKFANKMNVDYVAISFPRSAEDILEAKELVNHHGGHTGIIAKIERAEAVQNLEEIVKASDGVMVARGDLAVEIGDAEVPLVQKDTIKKARRLDKPVIIATQMMESMITSTVPTRAEVSDVANGVLENADAVMLSAETAVGDHPLLVIEAMSRVCITAEQMPRFQKSHHRMESHFHKVDEAIAMATMYTANHFDISAVISLTESGGTALMMSRIRTGMPIYGLSRFPKALGRMSLYRGVYPIEFDVTKYARDDINRQAVELLVQTGALKEGESVILTKGDHLGEGGGTNAMKVLVVGKVV